MAKRRRMKGGRGPARWLGGPDAGRVGGRERPRPEPDLMGDVRRCLNDPDPLALLSLVSMLLEAASPRSRDVFGAAEDEDHVFSGADLVATFADVPRPETTALLAVAAALSADEVERRRLGRIVAGRGHALPPWLAALDGATAGRTVVMTHILGDGDDLIVGVRLPTGQELTSLLYVDHNLGGVAKDGFLVPQPVDDLIAFMRSRTDDPDLAWTDIDPADARARITDAITQGAMTYPPFESDTWPACRPLVEWAARLLPEGGSVPERPEWSDAARNALARRFLSSPQAASLHHPDYPELLDQLLWFACDYGPGDPMRWSPTAVEILMVDWFPRKIVADVPFLTRLPELLRAFIRFCHEERGIRPALTTATVGMVDELEGEYRTIIRSPRPQGPAALLAAMGVMDHDDAAAGAPWSDPLSYERVVLRSISEAVGGDDVLDALGDADPLPDEPFRWDGVPVDVHERVAEVLALTDRACDALFDVEYRTACRRFLAAAAAGDPAIFRRRARADTAAAAVCWCIGKANHAFVTRGEGPRVKDVAAHCGLSQGTVAQRADTLLRGAGGGRDTFGEVTLRSPRFLVSGRRRGVIENRDRYGAG